MESVPVEMINLESGHLNYESVKSVEKFYFISDCWSMCTLNVLSRERDER